MPARPDSFSFQFAFEGGESFVIHVPLFQDGENRLRGEPGAHQLAEACENRTHPVLHVGQMRPPDRLPRDFFFACVGAPTLRTLTSFADGLRMKVRGAGAPRTRRQQEVRDERIELS